MTPEEILYKIPKEEMPDGLTVSGGEPFAQPEGLLALLEEYRKRYSGDILIFTGYCLEELEQSDSEVIQKILKQTDVLIDEVYIENLNDGKGLRGSSNQRIHIFHEKEKYEDAQNWERKLQCTILDHYLWLIGIPPTEESKENE